LKKRTIIYIIADILVVTAAFLFFIWLKPASRRFYLPEYYQPFLLFLFVWVSVSAVIDKYRLHKKDNMKDVLFPIIAGDFIILATITALIYATQQFQYSRMIVFGTIGVSFAAELLLGYLLFTSKRMKRDADQVDLFEKATIEAIRKRQQLLDGDDILQARMQAKVPPLNKDLVIENSGAEVFDFITNHLDIEHMQTLLVSTSTQFNIENQPIGFYNALVNLKRVNDIPRINKFFEAVNRKLPVQGYFIGCAQTNSIKKRQIIKAYPFLLNYLYYLSYFIWKRVLPKLPISKKLYFLISRGRNRALSKAELFGRLYSCGFEVVADDLINDQLYYTARKIQEPAYDYHPTYGAMIRLKRIGKNGRIIYVYKMRTMHPYSEYLQQYVYDHSNLKEGGKFNNDFRVTTLGKFMRRFWIDEWPMILNLLRGDLKLVGVRPLSRHYFDLYEEDLKDKRIQAKPGLIPPFYADMPKTLDEIQESENRYLDASAQKPFATDFKYFWKAVYNIIFKKARSN
jgi:lipopolysaccharide/colanic/teichoic acid biosynthesis glycosyltransferase